jgi:hypothetical protein
LLLLLLLLLDLDRVRDLKLTVCLGVVLCLLLWQVHGWWHHR